MSICVNTFSIVASDPKDNSYGVAVASKFLAVGSIVSWAKSEVGAIATQAHAKIAFGPDGLQMLEGGRSASEVLSALIFDDPGAETRQLAIVDAHGGVAAHTGIKCHEWAGHLIGDHFSCQGNILVGSETLEAMETSFVSTEGELSDRLIAALEAGDAAGGDSRGKQSAAILVVKPGGGYGGDTDRYLDLRVDDHQDPVSKLSRLVEMHHLFFGSTVASDLVTIDEQIATELQLLLKRQGYDVVDVIGVWNEASKQAFWSFVGKENLEERWNIEGDTDSIDVVALQYLKQKFNLDVT
ncbi:MAG: fimbrial assembly protein FimA [Anaerolineaceae bacterium]|nr:fimbrial assembly protein FimA [Anaerolineaceae bacterium]|tara:strand:+ start:1078 stop:1968 length:891 start_codon:yes stop_codon:yes gene_type:complete